MRLLLVVVTFLIIYGSLFPFAVDLGSYHPLLLDSLFHFGLTETSRGDLVENILLFVPFGFLAINVFPGRSLLLRFFLVLSVSFVLAFGVQVAQLIIPGRIPAGSDAVWNLIGCAVGCALGLAPLSRILQRMVGFRAPIEIPVILALSWIAYNLAPFVPSLDWQLLKDHVKGLISTMPSPLWVGQSLVMWLIVFHFLRQSGSGIFSERNYHVIVLVTLAAGFLMVGRPVSSDKIIGGLLALSVWFGLRKYITSSWLAALLLVVITGINFTPFEIRGHAASFSWVPFSGALGANVFINVLAFFKKLVLYGSLIWLLVECELRLRTAVSAVTIYLFASEHLQVFFVSKTPEITDPLMAVMLGIAFYQYRRRTSGVAQTGAKIHLNEVPCPSKSAAQGGWHVRHATPSDPPHNSSDRDGLRAAPAPDLSRPQPLSNHGPDGDWINCRMNFRRRQIDKLRAISQKQGISLSAAARTVLADFMSEPGEISARPHGRRNAGDLDAADDHAVEACRVNLLKWQYEFLRDMAQRVGSSIDELLGTMVDQYRIAS